MPSYTLVHRITGHRSLNNLAFSPDGKTLATSGSLRSGSAADQLCLWNLNNGGLITAIAVGDLGHPMALITSLLFVDTSRLMIGTNGGHLLDIQLKEDLARPERCIEIDLRHERTRAYGITTTAVLNITHRSRTNLFACSIGEQFIIFHSKGRHGTATIVRRVVPRNPSNEPILRLQWMRTFARYSLLAAYATRGVIIYDTASREIQVLPIQGEITSLTIHPDESVLVVSNRSHGEMILHRLSGHKTIKVLRCTSVSASAVPGNYPFLFIPDSHSSIIRGTSTGCLLIYQDAGQRVIMEQLSSDDVNLPLEPSLDGSHALSYYFDDRAERMMLASSVVGTDVLVWERRYNRSIQDAAVDAHDVPLFLRACIEYSWCLLFLCTAVIIAALHQAFLF
ncbi:hypothetical protein CVT24_002744 [Panaeolus cyanescens]|uniref:Anaphase-promoting complex subunit 4 WD40 domain-containing protein n=1 Tax=Panaeolus cyanescens TaxID=181874 RepID=A0A409WJ76_9AGAR|nr:hypothetical protein CVT24_002744 [Panaeolus cyanescens]